MDFISLFSGIGGFDLGLERAGMACRAQVEIDKAARGVLAAHWPDVERLEDVTKAGKHNLPAVELICGGFPCQDVSIAGRRAGLDGERSGLWFEFARIVDELKPQWVLIENVPGLLSSNAGQDFKVILDGLVKFGYGVCWRILDAQFFGLAQRRRRLFIVASLGNGRSAQVLFERESSTRNSATGGETRQELARDIAATLRSRGENTGTSSDFEVGLKVVGTLAGSGAGSARPAGQRNELDFLVPFTKQRSDQYGTASVGSTLAARDYKDNGDIVLYTNVAKTITANYGKQQDSSDSSTPGNYIGHSSGVRRLTPIECERLQGFPDQWTAISSGRPQADSARYKQLGNAVAVPVAEWIARRIVGVS